jgi:hypothetical protein
MSSLENHYAADTESPDAELQSRARAYLISRKFSAFRRLDVVADRGVVGVSGSLASYYERQVAVESLRRVAGVRRVVDRIVVEAIPKRELFPPRFALPTEETAFQDRYQSTSSSRNFSSILLEGIFDAEGQAK